jgi:methylphosphotriester-DNA--protein-cysteine methyltransferase
MARALDGQECRVDRIARELGSTMRSLQRLFQERLGLSPKTFLRLRRFERLLTSGLPNRCTGYLQPGLDLGYYDQSHILRDFEEFLGMTPSRLLKESGYLSHFYNTTP